MARPKRNTAAAAVKADSVEIVQAVKKEDASCMAEGKDAVCAAEEKAASQEPVRTVVVEFAGKQIMAKEVLKEAEEAYLAAHQDVEIKTIELYISPEQNAAYYVVNGEASKDYVIQL